MSLIPLVDLPSPNAHKLTAAELNAIFAQFVQTSQFGAAFLAWYNSLSAADRSNIFGQSIQASQFGSAFVTWFAALPATLPSQAGIPWNNGGTLAVS